MKHKIFAVYNGESFSFTITDNVWWMKHWKRFVGITLSKNNVYLKRSIKEALERNRFIVGHEAIHIYQAKKLGWKFIPVYLWEWYKAGFSYRDNVMEKEAYNNQHTVEWTYL